MSDDLGYYIRYLQHLGDGGPPHPVQVGPYPDRESAEGFLTETLRDPVNKTNVQLVLREETVIGRSG
jgi:hypothetical protein